MFSFSRLSKEYKSISLAHNVKMLTVCAFLMSLFSLLAWIDNEVPIYPLTFENRLDYYNLTSSFFVIFFLVGLLLQWSKSKISIQMPVIVFALLSFFIFMDLISYLDLSRGNGITAVSLGYVTLAVIMSTRIHILISIYIINSLVFYFWAAQLPDVIIGQYKLPLAFVTCLSISALYIFEKQRRQIFETQKALAGKVDELNHALDVKSVFYGHIIHELRTPLNAIIGFSDMILQGTYLPKTIDKVNEYTGHINSSGKHLLAIVNELLDSTKIGTGDIDIHKTEINIDKTLQQAIKELEALSHSKNQTIEFNVDDNAIYMETDKRILKQIIFNLISNSIKYIPEDGKIQLKASKCSNDHIEIQLVDNGPGIDKEILASVNNPTVSNESYFVSNADGTGFGLIIVRQFVQLLGGNITFISEPDIGTKVVMKFPIK